MSIHSSKKHLKTAWVTRARSDNDKKIIKPWGSEQTWGGFAGIHGKILFIDKGKRTSLKFHKMKSEVLFLRKGNIEVIFGNESSFEDPIGNPFKTEVLKPGDSLLVQSCCPYRIIALENSEMIEIGNYISDSPVRVLDDYDRESEGIENLIEAVKMNI
jgi:mannose-6-phosphate isomerase-like protein (cupin superfamily)